MLPLLLAINLAFLPIGKVAIIDLHGEIGRDVRASDVVEALKEAEENPAFVGIILDIDSPGGSAVESHEIVRAIRKLTKPCVARISNTATSGAYWIASACNAIVADELSIVGSIGAASIFASAEDLANKLGIEVKEIAYPSNKSFASPFSRLEPWEKEHLEKLVKSAGSYFEQEIVKLRPGARKYLTGLPYLAKDARELVDYYGGMEKAKEVIENLCGVEVIGYEHIETRRGLSKLLEQISSFFSKISFKAIKISFT